MKNIKEKLLNSFIYLALVWVHIALAFQVYMLYLHFTDQEAKMGLIIDKIEIVTDKLR